MSLSSVELPAAVAAWDRTGRALCKPCDRVLAIRLTYTDRADRKTQHLEGRAYAVKFRDDEAAPLAGVAVV